MSKHIINSAIALAKKGLPIFPCNPETKQPLTTHGFKDATIDVHSIKAYWSKYPKAMIGLPTGSISKIWAVDCDGQEGKDNFLELCSYYGYQPDTLIQNTPSGGCHYLFVFPEDVIIRNSTSKIAKYIDVRGEGGYIIIAPSCRADGGCYTWENKKRTSEAPDWLITLVTQDKVSTAYKKGYLIQHNSGLHPYIKKAIEEEYNNIRNAPKGKRNETLNNAAFTLYQFVAGGGVNEHQIHTILMQAAYECGLTQDDGKHSVIKTINSGKRAGMKFPRCIPCSSDNSFNSKKILLDDNVTLEEHLQEILPPAPQPPMEAFPQKIQKMLLEVAKALVVPLPVVIATFLATLSCCIGRSRAIRIKKGWIEHGNLWIILLASSSVGKTPALDFFF